MVNRGDLVTVAFSGDYGKPRPALILQSDAFAETRSVTVAPLTSHATEAAGIRILASAGDATGLRKPSHVMVDKITTVQRAKIGQRIGSLDAATLQEVDRALSAFLGIA